MKHTEDKVIELAARFTPDEVTSALLGWLDQHGGDIRPL